MCKKDTSRLESSSGKGSHEPPETGAIPLLDSSSSSDHSEISKPDDDKRDEQSEKNQSRSVNGFESKEALRLALLSNDVQGACASCLDGSDDLAWMFSSREHRTLVGNLKDKGNTDSSLPVIDMATVDQKLDWVLENYDETTTNKQSLEQELRRLLVLKSYLVLDTEQKDAFDKVTEMASRRFDCPIALISLIDLGRQWFLSKQGLDARETPRKSAFCAHAIQSQQDCFVVGDATQDVRFQTNPLVTGGPNIRFYAGAPLLSPEGVPLGTLCVIDCKPRSQDQFGVIEQQDLVAMAAMAMQTMVEHKRNMSLWYNNLLATHFPKLKDLELELQQDGALRSLLEDRSSFVLDTYSDDDRDDADQTMTLLSQQLSSLQASDRKRVALRHAQSMKQKRKPKQLRFAQDRDGLVRTQIHTITSIKKYKDDLWWSPEEMRDIRIHNLQAVKHVRKYRYDYIQCVQELTAMQVESYNKSSCSQRRSIESYGQLLSIARGLELHIVCALGDNQDDIVQAVLDEQWECQRENVEDREEYLRAQSLIYSERSTRFAANLGLLDEWQALNKKWETKIPTVIASKAPAMDAAPVKPRRTMRDDSLSGNC